MEGWGVIFSTKTPHSSTQSPLQLHTGPVEFLSSLEYGQDGKHSLQCEVEGQDLEGPSQEQGPLPERGLDQTL